MPAWARLDGCPNSAPAIVSSQVFETDMVNYRQVVHLSDVPHCRPSNYRQAPTISAAVGGRARAASSQVRRSEFLGSFPQRLPSGSVAGEAILERSLRQAERVQAALTSSQLVAVEPIWDPDLSRSSGV